MFFGAFLSLSFCLASGPRLVPFYRSPQSPVPSGQETTAILSANEQQKILRSQMSIETKEDGQTRNHLVEYGTVATDIHVSEWALTQKETSLLGEKPERRLLLKRLTPNEHVQILSFQSEWAEVFVPRIKLRGFVRWMDLKANYFDMGLYYLMVSTPLRTHPQFGSKPLLTAVAGSRVRAHSRSKGWIEVIMGGRRGYLPTNAILSKFDFITTATKIDSAIENSASKQKVQTIHTDGNRAIICEATEELNIHQRVKILRDTSTEWVQSRLPEHGLVWWKSEDAAKSTGDSPDRLTIEQLLKRDIYSVAFHPQNEKIGLVSANGVYSTMDGQTWSKLSFFDEEMDYAVHIHSDGSWFVGHYRSKDQGRNFREFLQWDRITSLVQEALTRTPQFLKLISLKTPERGDLEMILDTGYKKIHLISSTSGSTWLRKR